MTTRRRRGRVATTAMLRAGGPWRGRSGSAVGGALPRCEREQPRWEKRCGQLTSQSRSGGRPGSKQQQQQQQQQHSGGGAAAGQAAGRGPGGAAVGASERGCSPGRERGAAPLYAMPPLLSHSHIPPPPVHARFDRSCSTRWRRTARARTPGLAVGRLPCAAPRRAGRGPVLLLPQRVRGCRSGTPHARTHTRRAPPSQVPGVARAHAGGRLPPAARRGYKGSVAEAFASQVRSRGGGVRGAWSPAHPARRRCFRTRASCLPTARCRTAPCARSCLRWGSAAAEKRPRPPPPGAAPAAAAWSAWRRGRRVRGLAAGAGAQVRGPSRRRR